MQMSADSARARASLIVPDQPALVAAHGRATWLSVDGELSDLDAAGVAALLGDAAPFVCHMPATARRLGVAPFFSFDLLELFAFVRPAAFCIPTPGGLAEALSLAVPETRDDDASTLMAAAEALLREAATAPSSTLPSPARERGAALVEMMATAGWAWGEALAHAFSTHDPNMPAEGQGKKSGGSPLAVWSDLPEWQEQAPEPPTDQFGVSAEATRARLGELLGTSAEPRPQQADYASAASQAFAPREDEDAPHVVLAEAGTGVGKTLGYIAPASLWAERNDGAVWVSTYTRNLQRQIDQELDRLYPAKALKAEKAVVRKGRENYLCLLNLEEATTRSVVAAGDRIGLGLMARWIGHTRDGDMTGGDFPAWLVDLLGYGRTRGLTDRRGECIYSACNHWRRCFIETSQRKARRADIVIANHALVMTQAARQAVTGTEDDARVGPVRLVFDEGHHLFDAADGAFSAHLSGRETRELRRWLLGSEARGRAGRGKGLQSRVEDLIADREHASTALKKVLAAARALSAEGWLDRVATGEPHGPTEIFLATVRQQVRARSDTPDSPYDLETPVDPPLDGLISAAEALEAALKALAQPLSMLSEELVALLDDQAASLETATRQRIEGVLRGLAWRAVAQVGAWRAMLRRIVTTAEASASSSDDMTDGEDVLPAFVDWLAIDRHDGRDLDVSMRRHHLDPTEPFAELVLANTHGALITSATLRDSSGDEEADWQAAEQRTGARFLSMPAVRAAVPSPFDHAGLTRVLVVNDVRRTDLRAVASGYRELFAASGGGALGLFTAIRRLQIVHGMIAEPLDELGLPLWAQHVDAMDNSALVDIFRADRNACLLGTDAMRDGVDVPGSSLRLIVFDRVPWPRASYLHKARRKAFGGRAYDELLTRMKLRQAYGRLVRRADDRGIFVMMDSALPTRLLGAFPPGVQVDRLGLRDAVREVAEFFRDVAS